MVIKGNTETTDNAQDTKNVRCGTHTYRKPQQKVMMHSSIKFHLCALTRTTVYATRDILSLYPDFSGSDLDDCSCSETSYTLDFSYTSLSSLRVDSIVTSELNRLRDNYHQALEIKNVSWVSFDVENRYHINLLWPSHATSHHGTRSTIVNVIVC